MHHPGAVVVVPVDGDDALLVRQYRVAVGGTILEVPAGKRDVPGEAPAATAARELEEEIGRRAGRLEPLCEFFNTPGFCDEYTYLFLATDLVEVPRNAVSAEEAHMQIERVPLDRGRRAHRHRRDRRREEHHRAAAGAAAPRGRHRHPG